MATLPEPVKLSTEFHKYWRDFSFRSLEWSLENLALHRGSAARCAGRLCLPGGDWTNCQTRMSDPRKQLCDATGQLRNSGFNRTLDRTSSTFLPGCLDDDSLPEPSA